MSSLRGTLVRVAIFLVVTTLVWFFLLVVFGQFRFQDTKNYFAVFRNVSGLESGDFVRIAGVEVGKVQNVSIREDSTVVVDLDVESSAILTEGSRAVIRYENLIGDRFLALEEGAGGTTTLQSGDTIPLARTQPALDLDALIGGFRPLFNALEPDQINALTGQLIEAFQGQGPTISSFLSQTAALTNTLADRDQLIGQVINNLNVVLGSLGDENDQLAKAVGSLSELVDGLEARKQDVTNGVVFANEVAVEVADLLRQARPPLQKVVRETDRTAGIVVADAAFVDNLLATLPDAYRILNRQGLYGDYFSFYLCDIVLKLNGKGGQPIYAKLAGQQSGRCTPK